MALTRSIVSLREAILSPEVFSSYISCMSIVDTCFRISYHCLVWSLIIWSVPSIAAFWSPHSSWMANLVVNLLVISSIFWILDPKKLQIAPIRFLSFFYIGLRKLNSWITPFEVPSSRVVAANIKFLISFRDSKLSISFTKIPFPPYLSKSLIITVF